MFHQRHKSLTQNHNQNIDDFNLENCLPDDLKKTVHLNLISHPTSIESLKQSRLLTHQRVLRNQKYTPSKIIDFDRNWQRYTKKELHKYVENMQRDLIEVRRKLSDFNQDDVKHNDFRINQIQKSAEQEPLKLNQNSINKEALKLIQGFLPGREKKCGLQDGNIYQREIGIAEKQNLEEFDSEYNTQKVKQILQLTTKHSKNLNSFNNDKMTPRIKASVSPRQVNFTFQNSFINQKNLTRKFSQEKYDKLEQSYKTKLEKFKRKYCEMKLFGKTLQQQNINKEKILQNLKKTNIKTTTGCEDSFDRADTLFDNQNDTQKSFDIYDDKEGSISKLRNDYNSMIEKLKNISGIRDEDRNLIINLVKSFFNKSQKNYSSIEQNNQQPGSNLELGKIMELIIQSKSLSKFINPYILSKNQSLIELIGVINKLHYSVQSIQQQKKPLNLKDKNSATKLLKQSKSQGSNINLDYYYFANNPSKEEEATINLFKDSQINNPITKKQNNIRIPDLIN